MKANVLRKTALAAASVCMLFPLFLLAAGSVMGQAELAQHLSPVFEEGGRYASLPLFPNIVTMQNYVELLFDTPKFLTMFWNSMAIVFPALLVQTATGTLAAWGFARYEFPFKNALFTLYIVLMLLPFQVTMVPTYMVLDRLGLLGSTGGVILSQAFSAFAVFLLYRFFKTIPDSVVEAARIDGAGELTVFLRIALPLGGAGVMALFVLNFIELWNLIEPPLVFIKDQSLWPLSLFQTQANEQTLSLTFAASVMAMLPPLLLFLYGQTYLEQGISTLGQKD